MPLQGHDCHAAPRYHCRVSKRASSFLCVCANASATSSASCARNDWLHLACQRTLCYCCSGDEYSALTICTLSARASRMRALHMLHSQTWARERKGTWVGTSRRASAAYRSLASTIAASSRLSLDSAPPKPYVGCRTSSRVCATGQKVCQADVELQNNGLNPGAATDSTECGAQAGALQRVMRLSRSDSWAYRL